MNEVEEERLGECAQVRNLDIIEDNVFDIDVDAFLLAYVGLKHSRSEVELKVLVIYEREAVLALN